MNKPQSDLTDDVGLVPEAFQPVLDPVLVVDSSCGRIVDANPAACAVLAMKRCDLIGRLWRAPDQDPRTATLAPFQEQRFVIVGAIKGLSMTRDPLTGLATRDVLRSPTITADSAPDSAVGVLFVDLDHFKRINDSWGHSAGDRVLRIVSKRLSAIVRPNDTVVRYGGDEFIVLIHSIAHPRALKRLARRVARALNKPIHFGQHRLILSASVGAAHRSSPAMRIETLIADADRAMYRVKSRNRGTTQHEHLVEAHTMRPVPRLRPK